MKKMNKINMYTGISRFMSTIILSALLVCSLSACSSDDKPQSASSSRQESSSANMASISESSNDDPFAVPVTESSEEKDLNQRIDDVISKYKFEGNIYISKGGSVLFSAAKGNTENGEALKTDTPMPVGSVSKQFCAALILQLHEKGQLSIDDKLEKYYPEYEAAKNVTLKNMLSMRSGIPDITEELIEKSLEDNSEEENIDIYKKMLFERPLLFEPDTGYSYSNSNFTLLAEIAEKVTGQKYIDLLRENILTPVGMKHTGIIDEMNASADWAGGIKYKKIDLAPGITKGAGDILSTGEDIDLWLHALTGGKIISDESYKAMITDYSEDTNEGYGFGIRNPFYGGVGHPGQIGSYVSADVIIKDDDIVLFLSSGNTTTGQLVQLISAFLNEVR